MIKNAARTLLKVLVLVLTVSPVVMATPVDLWYEWQQFLKIKQYLPIPQNQSNLWGSSVRLLIFPVNVGEDQDEALALLASLEDDEYYNLVAALKQINWEKDNQCLIAFARFLVDHPLLAEFLNNSSVIAKIVSAKGTAYKVKEKEDPNVKFLFWVESIFAHYGELIEGGGIEEEDLLFVFNYQSSQDILFSFAAQNCQCLPLLRQNPRLYEAAQILPLLGVSAISSVTEAINFIIDMPLLHSLDSVSNIVLVASSSFYNQGQIDIPTGYDGLFSALISYLTNIPELEPHAVGVATYVLHHGVNGIGSPPSIVEAGEQPLISFLNAYWHNFSAINHYSYEDMVAVISSPESITDPVAVQALVETESLPYSVQATHDSDTD